MKKLLVILAFAGFNAFAHGSELTCTNGTPDEMGDSWFGLKITDAELNVRPYESGFSISFDKLSSSQLPDGSKLIYATDFEVAFSSEGEEYVKWLNVLTLVISADQSKASVTYSFNGDYLVEQKLKCTYY